nr:hypothetical protein [Tanacetum cinerariifolium]
MGEWAALSQLSCRRLRAQAPPMSKSWLTAAAYNFPND